MGRTYSDQQLAEAVAGSTSWREVLRHLGLSATSSAQIRSVRGTADALGLDYAHFSGNRRWVDADLARAVSESCSWAEVARALGITGGSAAATAQRHATRLGLALACQDPPAPEPLRPDISNLSRAGSMIAASWYTMCGAEVSWPLEPCRYDLLVVTRAGARRVQVKTVTNTDRQVNVSTTTRRERRVYAPDEVDDFFIIDADMSFYIIPIGDVAGLHGIRLSAYEGFRVR